MQNPFERPPEHIPTKAEIIGIISLCVESQEKFTPLRELYDEQGLRLLDLRIKGENPGETSEFLYTRKGILPNGVETKQTSIEVSNYQDGEITGGDRVAIFNYEIGEWEKV
jgi:hypothetical protein